MLGATEYFEFVAQFNCPTIYRHEIYSRSFSALRSNLRAIVMRFADGDDPVARELSDRFRSLLSEWLTVPVPFDGAIHESLLSLGEPAEVQMRWGADIRLLRDAAIFAAQAMVQEESPLRVSLRQALGDLQREGKSFKIYCHKTAIPHFQSIAPKETPLEPGAFLNSLRDYRDTDICDALIKVGPLRARGWGSAPDSVLTAPRFKTLFQFVWSGCSDESGFGYDPVSSPPILQGGVTSGSRATTETSLSHRISWKPKIITVGNKLGVLEAATQHDEDDFVFLSPLTRGDDSKRRATLLQVDDGQGILYPPFSRVISFDPALLNDNAVDYRLPGESLHEGMYLIRPLLSQLDLGGVRAEHGHYSRTWKHRLRVEFERDPIGLKTRLRAAGLDLVHLGAAIAHWCTEPTSVIHAPQQIKHFEILACVLGYGEAATLGSRVPWWRIAWNEIRHSRGEAIQAGVQEQEIVDEQSIVLLRKLLPEIQQKALSGSGFHLAIPSGHEMTGGFLFFKVFAIEEGFLAPETEVKVVRELSSFEQWRV